jgi:unsaturated rhamnogalacturonyl hydrolase
MIMTSSLTLRLVRTLTLATPLMLAACSSVVDSPAPAPAPQAAVAPAQTESTAAVMRRVFDWQNANLWSIKHPIDYRWGMRGWVQGAYLTGVMEAYRATQDEAYLNYARKVANDNSWKLGPRPDYADDHIVGQTYLELHRLSPADSPIEETRLGIDRVIEKQHVGRKLWWWCDAIYMAPQTFAKLAQVTGDKRYLVEMDRLFWDATEYLYDPVEKLYYRDDRFFVPKDGKKIFWSRGNGWVFAGLARLIDELPADHPTRERYITIFREMASRIAALQPADGLWRSNLLHPEPLHGEASGSAFFCYGFAWGINKGILPAAEYRPVVDRAWKSLLTCVGADGHLGWVQPIGSAPDAYSADTSQEYGSGAFLSAGSQVMKLP